MIAIQVNPRNFAEHSVNIIEHSDAMSVFQNLWLMQTNDVSAHPSRLDSLWYNRGGGAPQ
jgi:hypothetical protein